MLKKKESNDPSFALLSIAHEFKIPYSELMEMPISAIEIYFDYLEKLNEEIKRGSKKK